MLETGAGRRNTVAFLVGRRCITLFESASESANSLINLTEERFLVPSSLEHFLSYFHGRENGDIEGGSPSRALCGGSHHLIQVVGGLEDTSTIGRIAGDLERVVVYRN